MGSKSVLFLFSVALVVAALNSCFRLGRAALSIQHSDKGLVARIEQLEGANEDPRSSESFRCRNHVL
jgi:hypothetical protein